MENSAKTKKKISIADHTTDSLPEVPQYRGLCKAVIDDSAKENPAFSRRWIFARRAFFKVFDSHISCGSSEIDKKDITDVHLYHCKQWGLTQSRILKVQTIHHCYLFAFAPWNPQPHLGHVCPESEVRCRSSMYYCVAGLVLAISLFLTSVLFDRNGFLKPVRLIDVNIDFRTVIPWTKDAKCLQHHDQIILAKSETNQYVECGSGDTVIMLGPGDDWVDDANGNDIILPGKGNDIIDAGSGSDIFIFNRNWGHDTITLQSHKVDTDQIPRSFGAYPYKYSSFIIFGADIERQEIAWKGKQLVNVVTGDTISLNTKDVNILFASAPIPPPPSSAIRSIPQEPEKIKLESLSAESVFVQDDIAYYARGSAGLYIIDLTRIEDPKLLSKTIFQGMARSVQVQQNIAYVAQDIESKRGWLSVVNIKDKRCPEIVQTIPFGGGVRDIAITENTLYLVETHLHRKESRLHIFAITNNGTLRLISTTNLSHLARDVAYLDGTLYLSRERCGIQVYDVRRPGKPQMTAEYGWKEGVRAIKVHGEKIIVNQEDNHFKVLAPAPKQTLYTLCDVETPQSENSSLGVDSIWIRDNMLFRAEGRRGVTVIDISDPRRCRLVASIPVKNLWAASLYIIKNTLVAYNERKGSKLYNLDDTFPEYMVKDPPPEADDEPEKEKRPPDIAQQRHQQKDLSTDQLQKLLYDAARDNDAESVTKLCRKGAKPNTAGHLHMSSLELGAKLGSLDALRALLECPGEVTPRSMTSAALANKFEAMKILEEYGGDIGQKDEDGCTTLHYLAEDGTVEEVRYLVERGVPVNAVCRGGETALMWAQRARNKAVAAYLLRLQ